MIVLIQFTLSKRLDQPLSNLLSGPQHDLIFLVKKPVRLNCNFQAIIIVYDNVEILSFCCMLYMDIIQTNIP